MYLGPKLKRIRRENDLSQKEMAELLFTTQGNYCQYESNKRIPSVELLQRLIEKFKLDANWLLSVDDERICNRDDGNLKTVLSDRIDTYQKISTETLSELITKLNEVLTKL